MANFHQIATALLRTANDQQAAKKFLADPAAAWKAMGGSLPPGMTPAQFSQRAAKAPVHSAIVSAANGQMSVMDFGSCASCIAVFGLLEVAAGGLALLFAPEGGWIPIVAEMTGKTTLEVGGLTAIAGGGGSAGGLWGVCAYLKLCP
jgi:hypothetical protein